jgi:hypothetical protein
LQILHRQIRVLHQPCEEATAEVIAFMQRHSEPTSIGAAKDDVRPRLTNLLESVLLQDPN